MEVNQFNERKIGYLVLSKGLLSLYLSALRKKFVKWKTLFFKLNETYKVSINNAAIQIQKWYKSLSSPASWKNFHYAIQMCMHRRKAIKNVLLFEMTRRRAILKMHKCIVLRRRCHFSSRSLERITRWKILYKQVSFRIIRSIACRKLQRWTRMVYSRSAKELLIIRLVVRCGGYSAVNSKLPKISNATFLMSVDLTVSKLQRAWYASKGQMALFMLFAARKAKMAYEEMLNQNARIIQNSWRAFLWVKLIIAAITNNRQSRIPRKFRAYQYRKWTKFNVIQRKHKKAKVLQKFFKIVRWKKLLTDRFKLRKAVLIFTRAKKTLAAMSIQRCYREHVRYVKWKKEELRKFYAQQRQQGEVVITKLSKIQRNWRQMKNPRMFSRHVLYICQRIVRRKNLKMHLFVVTIQKLCKVFLEKRRVAREKKKLVSVGRIWMLAKAYTLRLALWDRVVAQRLKRNRASYLITKNLRKLLLWRNFKLRFTIVKAQNNYLRLRYNAIRHIQVFCRRKVMEYYSAVRVAGRFQLKKRRLKEDIDRYKRQCQKGAKIITCFFKTITKWSITVKRIDVIRKAIARYNLEKKSAISMQRFVIFANRWNRFFKAHLIRKDRKEAEKIAKEYTGASSTVGFYWRRFKEKNTLNTRFKLRRKMIDIYNALTEARLKAEEERAEALEDVRRTEENMRATIAASWKQGSDISGKNYYYNYVTGESSWVPPENWQSKVLDLWVRNVDERLNVYYYNMKSGESRWLPPCVNCGLEAQRWCSDCDVAYCEIDFIKNHGDEADVAMQTHVWSLTEYEKDQLKVGDTYCIDCKRRIATKVCNTCWDPYCDECFRLAHHAGNLRLHKGIAYKRAKAGWMVVKAKALGETDYYINGTTGQTTYEKPEELMLESEKVYYANFLQHKANAEEHIKAIEKLQYDLEAACYERDTIIFDALNGGGNLGAILAKRAGQKGKKPKKPGDHAPQADIIVAKQKEINKPKGFFSKMLYGDDKEYNSQLLNPDERRRGAETADYIKTLMDQGGFKDKKSSPPR